MLGLGKSTTKTSARRQIAIKGVRSGILQLPNHHYRVVLKVSSLNFELKSEEEQDAIIDTYESFLNSVGSPVQILIRTREIDMDKYLSDLKLKLEKEIFPVYRAQLLHYDAFIRSLITSNKILTRNFYIIIPYQGSNKEDFDVAQEQLRITLDIVSKGLSRLGMYSEQLTSLEVLDLFYSFYSPMQAKVQPLTEQALRILHTTLIEKGERTHAATK